MMFELILSFYIFIVEKLMHDSSNESVTWPIKQFLLKNAFWVKLLTPWIAGWLHFFLGLLLCFLWLLFSTHFHFSLIDAFLATNLVSAFFGLSAVFRLRPFYCCTYAMPSQISCKLGVGTEYMKCHGIRAPS
jgi:hypothetical protein